MRTGLETGSTSDASTVGGASSVGDASSVGGAFHVIDLSAFAPEATQESRARHARNLADACRTSGVFYIANHGVPSSCLQTAVDAYDAFFDLPLDERMRIAVKPGETSGYIPLNHGEFNDSFNCVGAPELVDSSCAIPRPNDNKWPERLPELKTATYAYLDAMHDLGRDVFSAIALSLELPRDVFDEVLGPTGTGTLRARRYPPQRLSTGGVGARAHTDGLALALIVQNDVPGLESFVEGVGFVKLTPVPGLIICQLGTVFESWTDGMYRANLHRIVNDDPDRERRSLVFWSPIRLDATIRSLLPPTSERGPSCEPIRFDAYLARWIASLE